MTFVTFLRKRFVISCDLFRFNSSIFNLLEDCIEGFDAVIPVVGDRDQYLCALYAKSFFESAEAASEADKNPSIKSILGGLRVCRVGEEKLRSAGIDPLSLLGANSPEELG